MSALFDAAGASVGGLLRTVSTLGQDDSIQVVSVAPEMPVMEEDLPGMPVMEELPATSNEFLLPSMFSDRQVFAEKAVVAPFEKVGECVGSASRSTPLAEAVGETLAPIIRSSTRSPDSSRPPSSSSRRKLRSLDDSSLGKRVAALTAELAAMKSEMAQLAAMKSDMAEFKEVKEIVLKEHAVPAATDYKVAHQLIWCKDEPIVVEPQEFHQAMSHFVLNPVVSFPYKCYYLFMSYFTVSVQIMALAGLLANLDHMSESEIIDTFTKMHDLDWFMHIVAWMLISANVLTETRQSQICELQVLQANMSDDPNVVANARLWTPLLVFLQKARQLVLIPLTVATAPILAIDDGVDALDVALNVMAIMFILDLDDSVLTYLSRSQLQYLSKVDIQIESRHLRAMKLLPYGIQACAFFSTLFLMLLYHPVFVGYGTKMPGIFKGGEPIKTITLVSNLCFGALAFSNLAFKAYHDPAWRKGIGACTMVWEIVTALLCLGLSIILGQVMGHHADVIDDLPNTPLK